MIKDNKIKISVVKKTNWKVFKVKSNKFIKLKLLGNLKIQNIICETGNIKEKKNKINNNKKANHLILPFNWIFSIVL